MDEHEAIEHFFHEHPLSRVPNPDAEITGSYRWVNWCYGCNRFVLPEEVVYGCCTDNCEFGFYVLHEECLEMPREIRHPLHPSHTLKQQDIMKSAVGGDTRCAVCDEGIHLNSLGYICSEGCKLGIHLGCAGGLELENKVMKEKKHHPSHPQHELMSFRKKMRSFSFECDACGTMEKGNSYICTICDYCIHESCAALAITADFPRHHPQHQLSLAFHTPGEYIQCDYECAICRGALRLRCWVYHCELCSYVVHIKCATDDTAPAASASTEINTEADDREDIITAPINNAYEEIIRPFVKNTKAESRELIFIPRAEDKEIINDKFEFQYHHHPLSFITFSASPSSQDRSEEDDDDDDDLENRRRGLTLTTCDGCTLPIQHQKSSSDENGYMSCGECNYFLHLSCFNLPPQLPSLPLHSIKDHKLMLQTNEKLRDWSYCDFCSFRTNGLIYACTECPFKLDIKCASLPAAIQHVAHPQDHHYFKFVVDNIHSRSFCRACYRDLQATEKFYTCHSCQFAMCGKCVWLPSRNKHRLEKHCLPLTYAVYVKHPSEFYCDSCEEKMLPKTWMYHCSDCDQSFHPECFPNTSGKYRNINFGKQQYRVNVSTTHHLPHHLLTFQIITTKKRCNLCHENVYEEPGFQCASCSFVMCLFTCGQLEACELKDVNPAND